MSESQGSNFPSNNVQLGHKHLDARTGVFFRYRGGDPRQFPENWVADGGAAVRSLDTSKWDMRQAGAVWFDNDTQCWKGWDGRQEVTFREIIGYSPDPNTGTMQLSKSFIAIDSDFAGIHSHVTSHFC